MRKVISKLTNKKRPYVLLKQILRSGTSIGANIEESKETHYGLKLLRDADYITKEDSKELIEKCEDLLRIIGSIRKTIKSKNS